MKLGFSNNSSKKNSKCFSDNIFIAILIMNIFSIFSCQSQNFHLAPLYDAALPFKNGIAAVKQGELWGFIDTSGSWVYEPRFTSAVLSPEGEYLIEEQNVIYIEKLEKEVARLKKNIEFLIAYGGRYFNGFNDVYNEIGLEKYLEMMKLEEKSFKYTSVLYKIEEKEFFQTIKDGSGNVMPNFAVLEDYQKAKKEIENNLDPKDPMYMKK